MSFRMVALVTAFIVFVLGLGYLLAGGLVVGRWQIEPTDGVLLLGRRMGAVYLGLAVMLFLARSAPASLARTALVAGATVILILLPALGILEFAAGHAGLGILVSAAIEVLLAVAFVSVLLRDRAAGVREGRVEREHQPT